MFTALCVLGLVGLLIAFVAVCVQSAGSPVWFVIHALNNSVGVILEAFVALVEAIGNAND